MMIGLAAMMCGTSGCFSCLNALASGGDGSTGAPLSSSTAMALDVVTSPIQLTAVVGYLFVVIPSEIVWYKVLDPVVDKTEDCWETLTGEKHRNAVALKRMELRRNYEAVFKDEGWLNADGQSLKFEALCEELKQPDEIPLWVLYRLAYRTLEDEQLMYKLKDVWKAKYFGEEYRCSMAKQCNSKFGHSTNAIELILDHPNVSDERLQSLETSCSCCPSVSEAACKIIERRRKDKAEKKRK